MRAPLALLFGGFVLSAVGMATATDAISLREVFHAVPVLGGLIVDVRLGMGTSLAHAAEPASGVLGLAVMLLALRTSGARAARALVPVRA